MTRSVWKGPIVDFSLLKKIKTAKYNAIRTWSRRSVVLPQFIGFRFEVHNGKKFIPLLVTEDMVGHKFGEFALTRKRCVHKAK